MYFSLFSILTATQAAIAGGPKVASKIVGGRESPINETPWVVALGKTADMVPGKSGSFCGGILLDPTTVLTAAHCSDQNPRELTVVARRSDFRIPAQAENSVSFRVDSITSHPNYNPKDLSGKMIPFDVAIWKVSLSGGNPNNIPRGRIMLDDGSFNWAGRMLSVSGWGLTEQNNADSSSNVLKTTQLPVATDQACRAAFPQITATSFCAGFPTRSGQDSCNGDSGGPLFALSGGVPLIVGLVSSGDGTCGERIGVYTKISDPSVKSFILQTAMTAGKQLQFEPSNQQTVKSQRSSSCRSRTETGAIFALLLLFILI